MIDPWVAGLIQGGESKLSVSTTPGTSWRREPRIAPLPFARMASTNGGSSPFRYETAGQRVRAHEMASSTKTRPPTMFDSAPEFRLTTPRSTPSAIVPALRS